MTIESPRGKVLVVAAHPDDEVLGVGGTIANHSINGDDVYIVIAAQGSFSRDINKSQDPKFAYYSNELVACAHNAADILGAKSLDLLSLPDNRLDSLDRLDIIQKLEQVIFQIKPDIIYTHHVGDVNIDHSYLHQAIVTACRPIPGFNLHRSLTFEIASSTEWQTPYSSFPFLPNVFVNIEHTWELKKKHSMLIHVK